METNAWKWFLSSFNHNYMDKPDFAKISAFVLTTVLALGALYDIYRCAMATIPTPIPDNVWNSLLLGITIFVGGHVAPAMTSAGATLKGKELDNNPTEDKK